MVAALPTAAAALHDYLLVNGGRWRLEKSMDYRSPAS